MVLPFHRSDGYFDLTSDLPGHMNQDELREAIA
jgi:hypothetical protein